MKIDYEPIKIEIIDFDENGIETEDAIQKSYEAGTETTETDPM